MRYREVRPRPPLDRFLECFWFVDADAPPPGASPERIVPDGCPELIVHLATPFERLDEGGAGSIQPRAFLVGTLTRPLHVRPRGRVRTMGVRFVHLARPARPLLRLSASDFSKIRWARRSRLAPRRW